MLSKIHISQSKQKLIIYIALAAITLAAYWQANQFDFINIDDNIYVTQNPHIQCGFSMDELRWAFNTTYADSWHPLIWLSFILDYQLYGFNAGGYHLTNLILHILSTLLLFWLFFRMTKEIWPSAFVAAFFALHPLHVESVAWISERKDVQSAFFWMLTLCLYVLYTEKPATKRYLLVFLSFSLALMSKSMVVTLPLIFILLDYWPLQRFKSQKSNLFFGQLKEKIPFFVLSVIFSVMIIYAHRSRPLEHFPFVSRLANAVVALITYLEKTLWPYNMAIFYPFPIKIPAWQVMGASLMILVITAVVIAMVKRTPYLFVGWLWYVITIAPVIGIIQDSEQAMADRYYYLPSIGIGIMLAWGIPVLTKSKQIRKKFLFSVGILFLAIMAFLSWNQCAHWKNSIELSKNTLQVTKNNFVAHNCLALALAAEGKIDEAIDHYNKAILIYPDFINAYQNRGVAYYKLGHYQNAFADLNKAISMNPDYADSYIYRGAVYDRLGQHQQAIEDYNSAIHLKEDYADAYNNRGIVYSELGQHQKAIEDFSKAIRLNPAFVDAYNNRAVVYLNLNKMIFGCRDARKACELGNCVILQTAQANGLCR